MRNLQQAIRQGAGGLRFQGLRVIGLEFTVEAERVLDPFIRGLWGDRDVQGYMGIQRADKKT